MAIKDFYDRFVAEIEAQKGIKISKLEILDDNGNVTIKATPLLQNVDISFTDSGEETTTTEPTTSTDGEAVIVSWDDATVAGDSVTVLTATMYNIYRSLDGETFTKVGTSDTGSYRDIDVVTGTTYYYYIVSVDSTGNEGVPSSVVSITF